MKLFKRYSRNRAARRREAEYSAWCRFSDNDGAAYTSQMNPFRDQPRHDYFAKHYHRLRVLQAAALAAIETQGVEGG